MSVREISPDVFELTSSPSALSVPGEDLVALLGRELAEWDCSHVEVFAYHLATLIEARA